MLETEKTVWVENLDEIKAALRNEFNRHSRALISAMSKVDKPDLKTVEVSNLQEVLSLLKELSTAINKISIPAPQVNVAPPEVNIPAPVVNIPGPVVNIPEQNLDDLIKSLDRNLNKLRTNDKGRPLAVRLSDGQNFIDSLKAVMEKQEIAFAGFNENMRLRDAFGAIISPATDEGFNRGKMVPFVYDYVSFSPAGTPTSIVFKQGGSGGTTVATLALTYSSGAISEIART